MILEPLIHIKHENNEQSARVSLQITERQLWVVNCRNSQHNQNRPLMGPLAIRRANSTNLLCATVQTSME